MMRLFYYFLYICYGFITITNLNPFSIAKKKNSYHIIGGNSTYVRDNTRIFGNAKIEMVGNNGGSSMLYICGNTSISGSVTMTGNIQTGGSSVCSGTYTKGQATISKVQACSQCK